MNAKLIKLSIVVLNFPRAVPIFLVYAKAIYMAMFENPHFTASAAKVTKLNIDIGALDAAETGCKTSPPIKTVQERNAALEKVKADLRSLRNDVQEVADADPANAEAIIASSGMSQKDQAIHGKQQNTAKDGVEPGSVDLAAEGAGAHEWRMSTDEKAWIALPSTLTTKTTVPNLTSGTEYYFQNRRMLRNNEKTEWSQSVKFRIR